MVMKGTQGWHSSGGGCGVCSLSLGHTGSASSIWGKMAFLAWSSPILCRSPGVRDFYWLQYQTGLAMPLCSAIAVESGSEPEQALPVGVTKLPL